MDLIIFTKIFIFLILLIFANLLLMKMLYKKSELVNKLIVNKLKRNDLPWEISDYKELEYIDPATLQVVKKASVRKEELARAKVEKAQENPQA